MRKAWWVSVHRDHRYEDRYDAASECTGVYIELTYCGRFSRSIILGIPSSTTIRIANSELSQRWLSVRRNCRQMGSKFLLASDSRHIIEWEQFNKQQVSHIGEHNRSLRSYTMFSRKVLVQILSRLLLWLLQTTLLEHTSLYLASGKVLQFQL
jgi:hypothetical protein